MTFNFKDFSNKDYLGNVKTKNAVLLKDTKNLREIHNVCKRNTEIFYR